MIKGIESNIANDVSQLTTLEKPNDESGTFMDSLNTFKDLLSDLIPFTEEKSNIATPKDATYVDKITPRLSVFPDKVVDVAEEVSRGVFQSNSTTQRLKFELSDISALQKVLADSLKASLLNTNASGTDPHMGINSSNSSLVGTAALSFFESVGEAGLSKDGQVIEDVVNVLNYVPVATDVYKNTIGTKDKFDQQIDLYSSVSNGLLIGGPAGAAFTIADAVTQEITGSSLFENFFEFGKETFNGFLVR